MNNRLVIDAVIDIEGVAQVHTWVREAALTRGEYSPCLPVGGGE